MLVRQAKCAPALFIVAKSIPSSHYRVQRISKFNYFILVFLLDNSQGNEYLVEAKEIYCFWVIGLCAIDGMSSILTHLFQLLILPYSVTILHKKLAIQEQKTCDRTPLLTAVTNVRLRFSSATCFPGTCSCVGQFKKERQTRSCHGWRKAPFLLRFQFTTPSLIVERFEKSDKHSWNLKYSSIQVWQLFQLDSNFYTYVSQGAFRDSTLLSVWNLRRSDRI